MIKTDHISKRCYLLSFIFTVILAIFLLILSSFLPQYLIIRNINESLFYIKNEGYYPRSFDYDYASQLDTYTDVQMLRATASTHDKKLNSILTNDLYVYENSESIIDDLESYVSGVPGGEVSHYVRYWMGFRVPLRCALVLLNYAQIRRYLAIAFFSLMIAVVCHIGKHIDMKCAYLFALSVILVRPNVIVSSLQFSCCFFIAFLTMLLIPWLYRNPKWENLFFMEIGMITMYFDFYTVPLITFAYPAIYLLTMRIINHERVKIKRIIRLFFFWFLGWVLMWIAKLGITTIFTDIDAISNGMKSFFGRVGIIKREELLEYYSIFGAFDWLSRVIFIDSAGSLISLLCAIVCLGAIMHNVLTNKRSRRDIFRYKYLLFIAVLPIIWFGLTAQPTSIHAWFQYRSVAIIYWGLGLYVYMILKNKKEV